MHSAQSLPLLTAWLWILPFACSISVPTGKLTPITPAEPRTRSPSRHPPHAPAPVVEYTIDHPEPPPLDPSYIPVTYKYISALSPNSIFYVPVRFRNLNNLPHHDIEYVFPRKYVSATVNGKGVDLTYPTKFRQDPVKNQYYPIKTIVYNPYRHDFGFTSRYSEHPIPEQPVYGNGKGSVADGSGKSSVYTSTSKDDDYSNGKDTSSIYKGYQSDKGRYVKSEYTTRKPSESGFPKKVLDSDISPRKYSYFVNHKY